MNFFEHQRAAKGTTLKLVLLFLVAVVALVAGIDGAVVIAMAYKNFDESAILGGVVVVTAVTLLLIGGRMFFKMLSLRQGGAAIAASLGAVPVDPTTTDPQLRRLVNIVEEMALASGVPAPRLFVMPQEPGINAFAAGFTPADAAITVTGGALAQLNRDELQGVIGHEFSHILNGDMRLNIRLIALLAGILLVGMIGLRFLQFGGRGSDSKGALPIVVVAAAMMALGFVGVFFANLIKAAVSRQREWLADASAVQFTRQTDGLEGALRKIGGIPAGSRLRDARERPRSATCCSAKVPGGPSPRCSRRIRRLRTGSRRSTPVLIRRSWTTCRSTTRSSHRTGWPRTWRPVSLRPSMSARRPVVAPSGPSASLPGPERSPRPICNGAPRCASGSRWRFAALGPSRAPPLPPRSPCCSHRLATRCGSPARRGGASTGFRSG